MLDEIKIVLEESPFYAEGYRKVWAKFRLEGIRSSKLRRLRVVRDHGLLAPYWVGKAHGPKAYDGSITTDRVDEMSETDITSGWTIEEWQARIFVAVDRCSFDYVGIHAAKYGTRSEALEPVRQGDRGYFGLFAGAIAEALKLGHDHGSQYLSDNFQNEIKFLGIESPPTFVRQPQGNGCAERFT